MSKAAAYRAVSPVSPVGHGVQETVLPPLPACPPFGDPGQDKDTSYPVRAVPEPQKIEKIRLRTPDLPFAARRSPPQAESGVGARTETQAGRGRFGRAGDADEGGQNPGRVAIPLTHPVRVAPSPFLIGHEKGQGAAPGLCLAQKGNVPQMSDFGFSAETGTRDAFVHVEPIKISTAPDLPPSANSAVSPRGPGRDKGSSYPVRVARIMTDHARVELSKKARATTPETSLEQKPRKGQTGNSEIGSQLISFKRPEPVHHRQYMGEVPGRGTEGFDHPVRAVQRVRCAENTSRGVLAQTPGLTLIQQGAPWQMPHSGFIVLIRMREKWHACTPKKAQGAPFQSPPATSPQELPGRDRQKQNPVRAARHDALLGATIQLTAPDATLAQKGRGVQERRSGSGSTRRLLECRIGRNQHPDASDDRGNHPAHLDNLTLGNLGKAVGDLLAQLCGLLAHLRLKSFFGAVDLGIQRLQSCIDLGIQRLHILADKLDLTTQTLLDRIDLGIQRRQSRIDLGIQRLDRRVDFCRQTLFKLFQIVPGRKSFVNALTNGTCKGFRLFPAEPGLTELFGGLERIEGGRPHNSLRLRLPVGNISALRALRQSLRAIGATLATSLCLATAIAAQPATPAYNPPPMAGTAAAALDAFERHLAATSGQPLTLTLSGTPRKLVFYAPFSIVWLLDEAGDAVKATARLTRSRGQLYLDPGHTIHLVSLTRAPGSTTDTPASGAQHPIAAFHDRFLTRPLARPVAGLAAGSRFLTGDSAPGGIVWHPDASGIAFWQSLGDHIVIRHGTGPSERIHWREIDTALKGREG